jgi:hypothetical protein
MRRHRPLRIVFPLAATLCVLAAAAAADAREIVLSPRYEPGDRYALALETTTETEALARTAGVEPFRERVAVVYRAEVEVLAVDAAGRPTRERHERVRVSASRGGEEGSLLADAGPYEVSRDQDGRVAISVADSRRSAPIERIVAPLLEDQLEHSPSASLLDPGREVEVGETWELSKSAARQLLRRSGVRTVRFEDAPTAVLRSHEDDPARLSLHYRIPVSRCEPREMPKNARAASSRALVAGRVDFPADGHGPLAHVATLELEMHGSTVSGGVPASRGWSLERSERSSQRTRVLRRAAEADAVPASLAP